MLIHLAVFACAAGIALLVRRNDRYEKEPWLMMLLALGLGFATMRLAGMLENSIFAELRLPSSAHATKAVIVAVVEDSSKLVAVLLVAYAFRRQINDPLDGVIYGTLVGLGAGVDESLLYMSLSPASLSAFGCEVTRLIAHALLGGLAGFAVGIGARPDAARRRRPLLLLGCVLAAILIHFLWDVIAYQTAQRSMFLRAGLMGLMLSLILSWGVMVSIARTRSARFFAANPAM
jgi:RsiW-degrading membrane proteinase PrsW (M82 family)